MTAYTAGAGPAAEARVRADLDVILEEVRREAEADGLVAVYLLGGYAKGEGTVVSAPDGTLRGFNDYDLLLVFAEAPVRPERYAELSARLARRLEIDFVDLGLATPRDLEQAPPTLFWYEFGAAHIEMWRASGAEPVLPSYTPGDIDREEGSRLLVNRGMALLWGALRLWSGPGPGRGPLTADPVELRFSTIASHKAITAAGDAALLRAGIYDPRQSERLSLLKSRKDLLSWAPGGFLDAYEDAAAYRGRPEALGAGAAAALWERARRHHEAGLRAAEIDRLGTAFGDWTGHRRAVLGARRRLLARPREAARALKRALRRGDWLPAEDRFLVELPALLYTQDREEAEPDAGWRSRAGAAVKRWHP